MNASAPADHDRVTIADVARLAQTSTASVSYYLNGKLDKLGEKTQRRIADAIRHTGYVPNAQAQGLAGKCSHVIAIVILDNTNIWAGEFLAGVESVALENGYATVVCTSNFDSKTESMYVEKMLSLGVDGFIIQPTSNFRAINQRITMAGKPVVFFDCSLYNFKSPWIKTNLYDGVYNATAKLIEAGYEDYVSIAANMTEMRTRMERFQGFADALAAEGLFYRAFSISHDAPSQRELSDYFKYKLHPSRRTLIFVQNQWALARVFRALKPMAHLIPRQIGLIGINCTEWTGVAEPTVTTVVEPVREEGSQACQMLLAALDGEEPEATQVVLECRVNWQGSTNVEING